jgi:hypothetical protein
LVSANGASREMMASQSSPRPRRRAIRYAWLELDLGRAPDHIGFEGDCAQRHIHRDAGGGREQQHAVPQGELAGIRAAATIVSQEAVHHRSLTAEAREHGQVKIACDARLAPVLQRDAADEAEPPPAAHESLLEGVGLAKQLDHRASLRK